MLLPRLRVRELLFLVVCAALIGRAQGLSIVEVEPSVEPHYIDTNPYVR